MANPEQSPSISVTYSHITKNNTILIYPLNTVRYFSSIILALPTNLYVIWLIVTGIGNGVASEFFSLNLFLCEIALSLQSIVCLLRVTFPSLSQLGAILVGFYFTGCPLFQCLIYVECYLAVVYSITFLKYKPLRYKVICCTAAWIIILISCGIASLGAIPKLFHFFTLWFLCQVFFTFSIKMFCCVAVLSALKQSGPGERGKEREEKNHMKGRALNVIGIIIISMVLIYAVYVLSAVTYLLTHHLIVMLWSVGHVCFVLGGLVQPLLFLHRTDKLPFCKGPKSS